MKYVFELSETLITISIGCSLLTMLFYKTKLYQAIRFICSIIILAYLIQAFLPLYSAIGELINTENNDGSDIIDFEDTSDSDYINHVSVGILSSVKSIIKNRYGINEEDMSVSVTLNNDDPQNIIIIMS